MIIIDQIEQGTADWFRAKSGVISASRATEFSVEAKLAPMPLNAEYKKDGKLHIFTHNGINFHGTNKAEVQSELRATLPPAYGDMRQTYMCELVAQVSTGLIPDEMSFKQCEWGKNYEHEARAYFEFETGLKVNEVAFIYKDENRRVGISPDGLINGKKIGLELKCPFTTKVFVEFVTCDKIKQMYYEQCQLSMWVTGYVGWYFANYDPRLKGKKLHHVLIGRDQEYMDKYDKAYGKFIVDMDVMLGKMGVEFGQHWAD